MLAKGPELTTERDGFPTQHGLPSSSPSWAEQASALPCAQVLEGSVQDAGLGRTGEHRERNLRLLGLPAFLVSQSQHIARRVDSHVYLRQNCHGVSAEPRPKSGGTVRPCTQPEGRRLMKCRKKLGH